jgi:hypothetical protein
MSAIRVFGSSLGINLPVSTVAAAMRHQQNLHLHVQAPAEAPVSPMPLRNVQPMVIAPPLITTKKNVDAPTGKPQPSLYDRVTTTQNLQIAGIVAGSVAVAAALGALTAKVGTLAASKMIATSTVAFLQPGITIFGFAMKTGMFITVNTVVPVTSGLITIALPVVSTVVVTSAAVIITLYVVNSMMKKMEAGFSDGFNSMRENLETRVKDGVVGMKNMVTELPGKVMRKIPGYSTIAGLFGSDKPKAPFLTLEQRKAARQERLKNATESANRASGALAIFENLHDENAIALLKGERKSNFAEVPPSKGLATLLDHYQDDFLPKPPVRKPGVYTRADFLRNQAQIRSNGENA